MRLTWKQIAFVTLILVGAAAALNPEFLVPIKSRWLEYAPPVLESADSVSLAEPTPMVLPSTDFATETEVAPSVEQATEPAASPSAVPASPSPATPTPAAVVAAAAAKTATATAWTSGKLTIPSLGITTPVVYVNQVSEKSFQLGLQKGVVQYPGTALPGQLGNMYIFGHSSDYRWAKGNYKTIFAKLPNIKVGAEVMITDGAGKSYKYRVTGTVVAKATDVKYLSQQAYKKKLLTLQTSYPIGTALKRYLVFTELVE